MNTFHTCAGIGGGALADKALGHSVKGFCEFGEGQKAVLALRFPGLPIHPDLTTCTGEWVRKNCGRIDMLAGGTPCQDFSTQGKGAGLAGSKSCLLWHQLRLLSELDCPWFFWENVTGVLTPRHRKDFNSMLSELARLGYGGFFGVLSSAHLGANHVRPRVWLLARKGHTGFSEGWRVATPKNKHMYPTPLFLDGAKNHMPYPANLRRRTPTLACHAFPELHAGMSITEINAIIGNRSINPDYVDNMCGFPTGWTDLKNHKPTPFACYPAGKFQKPKPTEPPIVAEIGDFATYSARIGQIGNSQDPQVAAFAIRKLLALFTTHKSFF